MASRNGLSPNWNHDGRRALRLDVSMKAALRKTGTTRFNVDVLDMSVMGFRCETAYNLTPGTRVWLGVPKLEALESIVMWREGFTYGCAFVTPLHHAVLDHVVKKFRKKVA